MVGRGGRIEGRLRVPWTFFLSRERVHGTKYACQLYQDSDSGRIDEEKKWRLREAKSRREIQEK